MGKLVSERACWVTAVPDSWLGGLRRSFQDRHPRPPLPTHVLVGLSYYATLAICCTHDVPSMDQAKERPVHLPGAAAAYAAGKEYSLGIHCRCSTYIIIICGDFRAFLLLATCLPALNYMFPREVLPPQCVPENAESCGYIVGWCQHMFVSNLGHCE